MQRHGTTFLMADLGTTRVLHSVHRINGVVLDSLYRRFLSEISLPTDFDPRFMSLTLNGAIQKQGKN